MFSDLKIQCKNQLKIKFKFLTRFDNQKSIDQAVSIR